MEAVKSASKSNGMSSILSIGQRSGVFSESFFWPINLIMTCAVLWPDFLYLFDGGSFPYGPYALNRQALSDILSWWPLTAESFLVSRFDTDIPFFLVETLKVFSNLFGASISFLIIRFVALFVGFRLMYLVFRKFLSLPWSLTLATLSIFCFTEVPLRSFVVSLFQGNPLFSAHAPSLLGVPTPALGFLSFIFLFFHTVGLRSGEDKKAFWLFVGWASQVHLYFFNFIIGMPVFLLTWLVRDRRVNEKKFLVGRGAQGLLLLLAITGPYWGQVLGTVASFSSDQYTNLTNTNLDLVSDFYASLYFFFPNLLILGIVFLRKVDFYDLWQRFIPIFALMATEVGLFALALIYPEKSSFNLVFSRFFIFLHFLYLLPTFYYLDQPILFSPRQGTEGSSFGRVLVAKVHDFFTRFQGPVAVFMLALVFVWQAGSAHKRERYFNRVHRSKAEASYQKLESLSSGENHGSNLVVSTNNLYDLLNLSFFKNLNFIVPNDFSSNESLSFKLSRLGHWMSLNSIELTNAGDFFQAGAVFNKGFLVGEDTNLTNPELGLIHFLSFNKTQLYSKKINNNVIEVFKKSQFNNSRFNNYGAEQSTSSFGQEVLIKDLSND